MLDAGCGRALVLGEQRRGFGGGESGSLVQMSCRDLSGQPCELARAVEAGDPHCNFSVVKEDLFHSPD